MNDEHVRELIAEVAESGRRISLPVSAPELRAGAPDLLSRVAKMPEPPRHNAARSKWRGRLGLVAAFAALLVVAVPITVAVALVAFPTSTSHKDAATVTTVHRKNAVAPRPNQRSSAQIAVGQALAATQSVSNFDLTFVLSGGSGLGENGVTGQGAVQLSPTYAMTLKNVLGADLAFGPNNAWEDLGSTQWNEYTLPAFGSYASGVIGSDAGALGTLVLSGPTGLLDLSGNEIGPTTEIDSGVIVDGESTTEYQVSIDPTSLVDAPGITSGEQQAIQNALLTLGSGPIIDDVYVDSSGYIVRTVSDEATASLQVNLTNFGNAGTVTLPGERPDIDSLVTLNLMFTLCSGAKEGLAVPDSAQNRALQKEIPSQSCQVQQSELTAVDKEVQRFDTSPGVSTPITTVANG
jgi:hypothetical protein